MMQRALLAILAAVAGAVRALRSWARATETDDAPSAGEEPRTVRSDAPPQTARTSGLVAGLLALCGVLAVGFAAACVFDASTQLQGITLGGSLAALAVALIVASARLVEQETAVEERPTLDDMESADELAERAALGGETITRRRLLIGGASAAGLGLGAAALSPVLSLGPSAKALDDSPWQDGLAIVDEDGAPLAAKDIPRGSFVTGFPEGADRDQLAAPIVIVRLAEDALRLPASRDAWAPEGILAFSKICTHAGCAINLYRDPLYEPTSPRPALVCPCHYSTFDPARGGEVIFGPAGRPLPQLPLRIDSATGALQAAGPLSGRAGPAYGTVRET